MKDSTLVENNVPTFCDADAAPLGADEFVVTGIGTVEVAVMLHHWEHLGGGDNRFHSKVVFTLDHADARFLAGLLNDAADDAASIAQYAFDTAGSMPAGR